LEDLLEEFAGYSYIVAFIGGFTGGFWKIYWRMLVECPIFWHISTVHSYPFL